MCLVFVANKRCLTLACVFTAAMLIDHLIDYTSIISYRSYIAFRPLLQLFNPYQITICGDWIIINRCGKITYYCSTRSLIQTHVNRRLRSSPTSGQITCAGIIRAHALRLTRKLSYRKDDRAMRPIYGCPVNFRESLSTPTATLRTPNLGEQEAV